MDCGTLAVFRVEHQESGIGPFMSFGPFHEHPMHPYLLEISGKAELPGPSEEGFDLPYAFFCGAPSLATLKKWFGFQSPEFQGFKEALKEAGFVLREYLVADEDSVVAPSGLQVFFDKDEAILVKEEAVDQLF